jgi:hypothetical protein
MKVQTSWLYAFYGAKMRNFGEISMSCLSSIHFFTFFGNFYPYHWTLEVGIGSKAWGEYTLFESQWWVGPCENLRNAKRCQCWTNRVEFQMILYSIPTSDVYMYLKSWLAIQNRFYSLPTGDYLCFIFSTNVHFIALHTRFAFSFRNFPYKLAFARKFPLGESVNDQSTTNLLIFSSFHITTEKKHLISMKNWETKIKNCGSWCECGRTGFGRSVYRWMDNSERPDKQNSNENSTLLHASQADGKHRKINACVQKN